MDEARPIDILLVEDEEGDIRLTKEAFKESKLRNNLYVVKDGEEAIKFLKKEDNYKDSPRPDIMLLDLNLPKKDGREVLKDVKSDDALKSIPVVVLTTSKAEEDIVKSYNLHANCYIQKPVDMEKFINVVKYVEGFWVEIVKLPPKD